MPTNQPAKNETPSDVLKDVNDKNAPDITAERMAELEAMVAELQAKNRTQEEAAAKVAAVNAMHEPELIAPKNKTEPDPTYIAYRHYYVEDGVQKTKDYRMLTEDFPAVCAERGW